VDKHSVRQDHNFSGYRASISSANIQNIFPLNNPNTSLKII